MKTLYLVRHGETEWNRFEVFRGRADIALNERGLAQANAVGRALKDAPLYAVISSPLKRAIQTAKPLAARHRVPLIPEEAFNDVDCGDWEGMPMAEVERLFPEGFRCWMETPHKFRIPGGESLAILRRRALRGLKRVLGEAEGEVLCVVSHRVVTKVMVLALLGLSNSHFWQIRQDNACINIIQFPEDDGEAVVVSLNDTGHLKSLECEPIGKDA
ncbi:MAG: histidine phosphatase family protein [Candidatus Eremiobacteraeota bacterium]|nr:histidine phosphatase family protein [Candidatus Eremiobacteraeota bacterium]